MEMDMQEPGEMCCCCGEAHESARVPVGLYCNAKLHAAVSRIVISCRGIK